MRKISHKSILFFVTVFIVVVSVSSFFFNLFFSSKFQNIDNIIPHQNDHSKWLNVSRQLDASDLKQRIILLDFWTYGCVNCINILPEVKKLEERFGNSLTVIGVHSGKFNNEKDTSSIKKAILKHDISHPVVNDSDFSIWNKFNINAWPSLVLIDVNGNIEKKYVGENEAKNILEDVEKLIKKFHIRISNNRLPIILEKNKISKNILNYPTKIAYLKNFSYKGYHAPAIVISNAGGNNIIVSSLKGEIILEIGSGDSGFEDGDFSSAKFNFPSGIIVDKNNRLFVADTKNNAIREVDFIGEKVSTLIENSDEKNISHPTDLEFFPDESSIAIANSGTHQILKYNLRGGDLSVLAGSGEEGIKDGKNATLAQTSDLSKYDGKLYFVDSESSSLRVLNKDGVVETLIGKGLFEFGDRNGNYENALMQHPLGLTVDDTGVYIADSFNHKIKKYDFSTKTILDFVGNGSAGCEVGKHTKLNEPDGIISILDKFYVADSNNNRIIAISRKTLESSLIQVMPKLQLPKESFLEYLPNLHTSPKIEVSDKAFIKINLQSGWKINESGPSFINLLKLDKSRRSADLIEIFDWYKIKSGDLNLPMLDSSNEYMLQGTIYYCESKENSLCHVTSYQQEIQPKKDGKSVVEVDLIYE
jgi:thiol-disulfide isomerase/thioredoxin/sugar lactone lactonase YvrE